MRATLTNRGQITLPKAIRDKLGLASGAVLEFDLLADNTITARQIKPDGRRIRGLLKSPHSAPLTVAQMDEGIGIQLRVKHSPRPPRRKAAGTGL